MNSIPSGDTIEFGLSATIAGLVEHIHNSSFILRCLRKETLSSTSGRSKENGQTLEHGQFGARCVCAELWTQEAESQSIFSPEYYQVLRDLHHILCRGRQSCRDRLRNNNRGQRNAFTLLGGTYLQKISVPLSF